MRVGDLVVVTGERSGLKAYTPGRIIEQVGTMWRVDFQGLPTPRLMAEASLELKPFMLSDPLFSLEEILGDSVSQL